MTNQERRQIITEAKAKGYTGSYVDLFRQAAQNPEMLVAETPEQKQAGLRPLHEAGRTDASMAFKDVPPNTPFNTVGMKAPIDIKKYDEQGHLVKSYENVPPGIQNLDTGPNRGTVLESPARMQDGGPKEDYNMARAQELGYKPDETGHYPSVDYETGMLLKSKEHPTVKLEFMSQMLSPERKMIANPTGYFGENQLQYVPRNKKQTGGYNPGKYMNEMQPKVFPNQQRDAKWVKYAADHDFAGRFPGETRTNKEIGLERSNRNTVPLPPNPVRPKELKRAQDGAFASDNTRVSMPAPPELYLNKPQPQPMQTFVGPQNPDVGAREREGLKKRFEADQKRRDAIEKGINPNLAFMMPQGLGADSEAKAAYQYDNPTTSNIGQIASGIGFLPIDRGLDIALTAAGSAIRKGADARAFKKFESEIDWGKWNPDTPNHPVLMDEYKQIEFATKKNGTWMKNADGSAYKGRPEQFVQEQSSHFKKAFPEGAYNTYRGIGFFAGEKKGMSLDPALGTNKVVFSAGEELAASPHYTITGMPETWKPGTVRDWRQTEGFIAPLYAKESKNSYRIISQGDKWDKMNIAGKSQEELSRLATSNSIAANVERRKMANIGSGPLRTATESKAIKHEAAARQYEWFANNYHIVNKNPTASPNFEQYVRDNLGSIAKTDEIGEIARLEGLDDVRMFGLNDGDWSPHVNMHINKPGNYLKSRMGNVGFFDMTSDDIFKAMVPLGGAGAAFQASSSGKRDTYKKGGYIKKSKKRRRAQEGQAVDYLLGALGQQGDMSAAEIGAQQAKDAAAITSGAQRDLEAEKENVQRVRKNIIPTAERIAKGWENLSGEDKEAYENILDYNPAPAGTTPEAKPLGPLRDMMQDRPEGLKEIMPNYNLHLANPGAYGSQRGIYCTTMGCFAYEEAGARQITDSEGRPIRGNETFVRETKKGVTGFEEVPASERQPGDMTVITGPSKRDYNKPHSPENTVIRPHHTVIYSGEAERPTSLENIGREALDWILGNKIPARDYDYNNPGAIKAYSAETGDMHKFQETVRSNELPSDSNKESFKFYRYIGQTPQAQRAVVDARNNQAQADLAAQALQQQADLAAQMPKREVDNVSRIDRRQAAQIETDDPTADIAQLDVKQKKRKKSRREVAETVANRAAGKVQEVKEQKTKVRDIKKAYKQKIKDIKSGQ